MSAASKYRSVPKSAKLQTRLRPTEEQLVKQAASQNSMTVSAWMRAVLITHAKRELGL